MKPIIKSILDTDAYKLHMQQAVFHFYPTIHVVYEFQCRSSENKLGDAADAIREQVDLMRHVALTDDEYAYLSTKRYLKKDYLDWLREYRFKPDQVIIDAVPKTRCNGETNITYRELAITIKGPWVETILWEVPLLAIVCEVVHSKRTQHIGAAEAVEHLNAKLDKLFATYVNGELDMFRVTDFGTRRRYSFDVQEAIVRTLQSHPSFGRNFSGTSNYHLAMKLGLPAVGTQAHEWFQAHQQLSPVLRDFQRVALKQWLLEYPQDLHIALTDCISMDGFLGDFDADLAQAYVGLRHDSGNPYVWGRKAIEHYKRFNIDPKLKTLVFSDSLDLERAAKLHCTFAQESNVMCGIGTQLTCSIPGVQPLSIVIKMTECDGKPVAKISDEPEKTTFRDLDYVQLLGRTFNVELQDMIDAGCGRSAVHHPTQVQ
ncbi:nicotinate phosphoribosyltransferase, putative [Trypanosoma equiperdum]|uniref:nicotinate phosphoribosyltransferase n=2 Tax=Trypanozoon TaxID=39700 RepID=Q389I2_TRYB2|nr:nicotinate phosphoribosyltransferase, putative [Trypanosoma brucei brucei TREU927]EAN78538.1 nicotinate phosphoribosyltransferase, putative [Trypanosoma brucei brucei TREU927]SCU70358.1 nicotinate phosphoribosyltransferase, putative [Trypanosoma equiperdum]